MSLIGDIRLAISVFPWEEWNAGDPAFKGLSSNLSRIEKACREFVTCGGSPLELQKAWAEHGPKGWDMPASFLEPVKHPPKVKRPLLRVEVDNNPRGTTASRVKLAKDDSLLAAFVGTRDEVEEAAWDFADKYQAEREERTPCACGACVDSYQPRRSA